MTTAFLDRQLSRPRHLFMGTYSHGHKPRRCGCLSQQVNTQSVTKSTAPRHISLFYFAPTKTAYRSVPALKRCDISGLTTTACVCMSTPPLLSLSLLVCCVASEPSQTPSCF